MSNDLSSMMDNAPNEAAQGETTEELIAKVLALREDLGVKRDEWQTFEAETKAAIEACEVKLMQIAESVGTDSLKCQFGTAFKQLKEHYRVGNWDEIIAYIKETGNFQMLEKRIGKLATQEIHKTTGNLPPGVSYSSEIEMVVRKAPSKG